MSKNNQRLNRKTHLYHSLRDKLNIIEAVNSGEKMTIVAKRYNISMTSVWKLVKNNREKKIKYSSTLDEAILKRRKTFRKIHDGLLEKSLLMWYNEKCLNGQPVSGRVLCKKALLFNEKLNGSKEFKASSGWLDRFKKRNLIQLPFVQGEKLSANIDAAIEFCFKFQHLIVEENYDLNFIFNATESGIYWNSLPKINTNDEQQNFEDQNQTTEKITCLFCANASSSYALPLLIIGKSWNSRSNLNIENKQQLLPVMYQNQSSACMTKDIFFDWYTNIFIPSVEEMQMKRKINGKVLLLIDSTKCHPSEEILNSVNENFHVKFIPSNIASLIQPMNQGIIDKTKRLYRKALITSLLEVNENITIDKFIEQHTMEDCCFMLANAFESITSLNLKNAWNKLCGVSQLDDENVDPDDRILEDRAFCQMLHVIKGFENVYPASVKMWLNADQYSPGWEPLNDDEIINFVTSEKGETIIEETLNDEKIKESVKSTREKNSGTKKSNQIEKNENFDRNKITNSENVEVAIKYLHNWCKKRKEYTESDYRLLSKWETLVRKAKE